MPTVCGFMAARLLESFDGRRSRGSSSPARGPAQAPGTAHRRSTRWPGVCASASRCARSVTDRAAGLLAEDVVDKPGPWPWWIATESCRSGSANVRLAVTAVDVPSSENSAVFCEIGSSWPSQYAQPLGGKLNPTTRISATKGSLMSHLGREDAEQRDDEADREVGLRLSCGCEPPAGESVAGLMASPGVPAR